MLIDVTRLLGRAMEGRLPTGVDRVGLEYIRHFSNRSSALVRYGGCWVELSPRDSERIFQALLSPGEGFHSLVRWAVAKAYPRSIGRRFSNDRRLLLNAGHSGLEQASYFRRLEKSALRPVFFIHDLIPINHAEYCRAGERERHLTRMDTALRLGKGLIVNSQATLDELEEHSKHVGIPLPPTAVARLAPPRLPSPDTAPPLSGKPYFVVLGTIEPRKNHLLLLQLWRKLIAQMGEQAPHLVVIGQRGWECENVVDLLERCETLKGVIHEHSAASDAELSIWLHHARALLFPSFAEGYGMPLVEALSLGVPAICSELPAFREIAGDIPEYADPLDGRRWSELVVEYAAENGDRRPAQLLRMEGFQVPTWQDHFQEVEALLKHIQGGD